MATAGPQAFAFLLHEFAHLRNSRDPAREEILNRAGHVLVESGWTFGAAEPCENCGLPCRWRHRDGSTVHPICPDAPPNLTWEELLGGTARLAELLGALRHGLGLGPHHGPCAGCGGPTRYRRPDDVHLHPSCTPPANDGSSPGD